MSEAIEKTTLIGKSITKPDAPDKSNGRTRYINDMVLPRMLVAKIKRSDRAHAKVLSIDTSKAAAVPGIQAIVTADDTPMVGVGVT